MQTKLHKNARTTPAIRKEIKQLSTTHKSADGSIIAGKSTYFLAKKYNLSWNTIKKWQASDGINDKSSRPNKIRTKLNSADEAKICFERKQFKKTVDDVYLTLENEIKDLYPMKVYRCLKRHNLSRLPDQFEKEERKIKNFKQYGIGYVHIDLLYAPKINKERKYVYTAIDRVSKVAYAQFSSKKTKESGASFLNKVLKFYPYKINYILTDNGAEFCYRALPKHTRTKKVHPFDQICLENKINHRTTKFNHPWTNGMVERFNRKVKDNVLNKFLFASIFEMEQKTLEYIDRYNHQIRLKGLDYKTPSDFMKAEKDIIIQRIVI